MDPVTMMVASIGMQFFNNYANNKKNAEIQAKQRKFQIAAVEHDFERMRKLQAESAKLALELEAEFHQERMKDIDKNYDELLKDLANSFTIENWPLSVLPFIMKGESFGSLFIGTAKSVNMHCIFTPSNCDWFNEIFYDDIDLRLEAEMNNNWNAQTTHPIVYYGGGWNRRTMSKGRSIPKKIDTVDIDLLKVGLKNVPIVVITPYFDPWLHFNVYLWGMGDDKDKPFRIDVSHGEEVEHTRRIFSYEYNKDMEKSDMSDEFINTTIEEFVPYLESLIGFLADKYFWSMYGRFPILPELVFSKRIDKHSYEMLYMRAYKQFPLTRIKSPGKFSDGIDYIADSNGIYTDKEKEDILNSLHERYLEERGGLDGLSMLDFDFLNKMWGVNNNLQLESLLNEEIETLKERENVAVWFCASNSELYQRILNTIKKSGITADRFVYQVKNDNIAIGFFVNEKMQKKYSIDNVGDYVLLRRCKQQKGCYEVNLSTMKTTLCKSFIKFTDMNYSYFEDIYKRKEVWLRKLINQHNVVRNIVLRYLDGAEVLNLTFDNLMSWVRVNCNSKDIKNYASFILAYNEEISMYYIVGTTSDRQKVFAAYCNTIDENLAKKFGNKLLLTINM